jgi:hypothetical protein
MAVTPTTRDYEPMMVEVVLIEFASSALWGGHLRGLNFGSCEEFLSTEEGRRNALSWMLKTATRFWAEFLRTTAKIAAAVGAPVFKNG